MPYTYQDFENAANAAGMLGQFSQYDLDLARRYPEAGLSLLSLKQDYGRATTDEQRLLANEAANQIRSSYGNYTGGRDGGGYYATQGAKYGSQIDDVLGQIGSFGSFSYADAPTYENAYAAQQKALLDAVLSHGDFAWSKETDPTWGSYKKGYLREGDRATANALAQASAASGGRPSSYAVGAATQAGDYYATKLNDIIPTLYQQAYERYLQDYQRKLSDLSAVNGQEQLDYRRYLDELGQYNADRSQAYNEYLNEYNMLQAYLGSLQGQDETAYTRAWNAAQAAQQQAQQAWENQFAERSYGDQQAQQAWENQFKLALQAAAYGDYSGLAALGITPNNQNVYDAALAAAGRVTPVGSGGYTGGGTDGTGVTGNVGAAAGAGGTAGGIDAGLAAQLAQLYPDGNVTSADDWSYLLTVYDETTLNAAGYRYAGGGENTGNGNTGNAGNAGDEGWTGNPMNLGLGPISDGQLQNLISEGRVITRTVNGRPQYKLATPGQAGGTASVTDYDSAIAYMKNAGVDSATRAGMMTRSEWTRRKASLQQYGTGGAEVRNYESYQDYIRAYCEYAASK